MLKRRKQARTEAIAHLEVRRFSIDEVLNGPRPGRTDAALDRSWSGARGRLYRAIGGTEFDPRHALRLEGDRLAAWQARRQASVGELMHGEVV
jgi:hypothetical protein